MRPEGELHQEAAFWHLDEELGELELQERPGRSELYTVRLKAHTARGPYQAERAIYPLSCDGTQHEISGKAYILVPDLTLTVGLFTDPPPSGPIGTVTKSQWQGMRHHDIANVRGLFYEEDRTLAIWEVDAWGRLDEFTHARLWLAFESFLARRFPGAERIVTDDAEPGEDTTQNQAFLEGLGYRHIASTVRFWQKEVWS
jgi:hypothetical protein